MKTPFNHYWCFPRIYENSWRNFLTNEFGDNVCSQGLQTLESKHCELSHYEGEEGSGEERGFFSSPACGAAQDADRNAM